MSKIVIFGTGSFAKLAHYYFKTDTRHEVVAFTVDKKYMHSDSFQGLPVVPFEVLTKLYPPNDFKLFVAIGYKDLNKIRREKCCQLKTLGYELVTYISSKCTFLTEESVGENCFLLENVVIQPFVHIGNGVIVWSGSQVAHDVVVEDYCFLATGVTISGNVKVGQYSFIGANATIRDGINIAQESLIGAGVVILKDTVEQGVYKVDNSILTEKNSSEVKI